MSLDKFLVLVVPLLVVMIAVVSLIVWGALGDSNDKQEPH